MNFNLTDEQTLLQQTVRQFAEEEITPGAIKRNVSLFSLCETPSGVVAIYT